MTPTTDPNPALVPLLLAAIAALTATVVFLFGSYSKRQREQEALRLKDHEDWAKERIEWAKDRVRTEQFQIVLRGEFEAKYHDALRKMYEDAREHEDQARRENAANVEAVAVKVQEASDRVAMVLDKIYERYIAPRRPPTRTD